MPPSGAYWLLKYLFADGDTRSTTNTNQVVSISRVFSVGDRRSTTRTNKNQVVSVSDCLIFGKLDLLPKDPKFYLFGVMTSKLQTVKRKHIFSVSGVGHYISYQYKPICICLKYWTMNMIQIQTKLYLRGVGDIRSTSNFTGTILAT